MTDQVLDVGADRKGGNLPGLLAPEEINALVETIHELQSQRKSSGNGRH
jgi:hypothetical protein